MLGDNYKQGQSRTERAVRKLAEFVVGESSRERVKASVVKN